MRLFAPTQICITVPFSSSTNLESTFTWVCPCLAVSAAVWLAAFKLKPGTLCIFSLATDCCQSDAVSVGLSAAQSVYLLTVHTYGLLMLIRVCTYVCVVYVYLCIYICIYRWFLFTLVVNANS